MSASGLTLMQFLASRGGMQFDSDGALKAAGLRKRINRKTVRLMVPGTGYCDLVRHDGLTIDQAKAAAIEAGYLAEGDDFMSAVAAALQGRPRVDLKVNTPRPAPSEPPQTPSGAKSATPFDVSAAIGHLRALAADRGLNLTETEMQDAAQLAAARKIEPLEALAEVLERNALAAQAEAQAASKEMLNGRPDEPGRAGEARAGAPQALEQRVGP